MSAFQTSMAAYSKTLKLSERVLLITVCIVLHMFACYILINMLIENISLIYMYPTYNLYIKVIPRFILNKKQSVILMYHSFSFENQFGLS